MADVEFYTDGPLGRVLLNRPGALNALTCDMVTRLTAQLKSWAADPQVKAVAIEGAGDKAFCAGGDIRAIAEASAQGRVEQVRDFFFHEYLLNRLIKNFPKPYIAFLGGITMGGGAGISIHGAYRVAAQKTVFAMPETGIGFFPDVGATEFLPRLPGAFGLYMALTGARVSGQDVVSLGLATHYIPCQLWSECIAILTGALAGTSTRSGAYDCVDEVLDRFSQSVSRSGGSSLYETRESVDRCFIGGSLSDLMKNILEEDTSWARTCYDLLHTRSPTSLHVAFEQMQRGERLDAFDDVIRLEYRLALQLACGPDFVEGVRAALIDRDNAPSWTPARLEDVHPAKAASYFEPIEEEKTLFSGLATCR